MSFASGMHLGPYEIQSAIGSGGMGEVYKARDTRLDRCVALKVLPEPLAMDSGRRARFQREATVIAGLNHPNICTLYDVGEHEGATFLVMELLDGETLAQRIIGKPMRLDEVVEFGIQIADALDPPSAPTGSAPEILRRDRGSAPRRPASTRLRCFRWATSRATLNRITSSTA